MKARPAVRIVLVACVSAGSLACDATSGGARASVSSAEAQQLYDSALTLERGRVSVTDFRAAERLYRRAIEADSSFVAAHAGLARIHASMVHFMYEPTNERRRLARVSAERALALMPPGRDALIAQSITTQAAEAYAAVGQTQRAIELLQQLVAGPAVADYSRELLALDSSWDALRGSPEFQRITDGA